MANCGNCDLKGHRSGDTVRRMSDSSASDSLPAVVTAPVSAWAPLTHPVFRMLWGVWITANVCMWMNDVAAAWLMTSLSHTPILIALVSSAATLPVFLLGIPSGALADIVEIGRAHV